MTDAHAHDEIRAAGGIVYRWPKDASRNPADHAADPLNGLRLCVVHRPKYGDASWPKGKLEPEESAYHAAVREIGEETDVQAALGRHIAATHYDLAFEGKSEKASKSVKPRGVPKTVDYWLASPLPRDVATSRRNPFGPIFEADEGEISTVEWLAPDEARRILTRDDDRAIVDDFLRLVKEGTAFATTFLLIRHGKAESRKTWGAPDGLRPLMPRGAASAYGLSREIACFAPLDLYSSPWKRCADTIGIYAMQSGQQVAMVPQLTEDAFAVHPGAAWDALHAQLVHCAVTHRPAAVCMHRPVIGGIMENLRAMCASESVAQLLPLADPYLATGNALALSLVDTGSADGPVIVDVEKVNPIVY